MKIRDIIREIVIAEFIDKQFNHHQIYEFVWKQGFKNISPKQCRDAIIGLQRMGNLVHTKLTPSRNSYFMATRSIFIANPIQEAKRVKELEKEKQVVYENKYLQLISDYVLIDSMDGKKLKGFDGWHSGNIERARQRNYPGCSMGMV
jgi:hypothetical protein